MTLLFGADDVDTGLGKGLGDMNLAPPDSPAIAAEPSIDPLASKFSGLAIDDQSVDYGPSAFVWPEDEVRQCAPCDCRIRR
jgi:hypothetical protein